MRFVLLLILASLLAGCDSQTTDPTPTMVCTLDGKAWTLSMSAGLQRVYPRREPSADSACRKGSPA